MWPGELRAPLQRPKELKDRTVLTDEELAKQQAQSARQAAIDNEEFAKPDAKITISPPSYWVERGTPSRQTSLIVDPPDGRLPEMTPDGKTRLAATPAEWRGVANTWEDLSLYYRCVTRGVIGTIAMMPSAYDNGNQIIQAPGYVVIRQEMIHEARVILLDGRPHPSDKIRQYMGDSRGPLGRATRWCALVSTNFTDKTSIGGNGVAYNGQGGRNSDALKVVERFTRKGPDTLEYKATIDVIPRPGPSLGPSRSRSSAT